MGFEELESESTRLGSLRGGILMQIEVCKVDLDGYCTIGCGEGSEVGT